MSKSSSASASLARNAGASSGRDIKPGVVAFKRARILEEASALFFEKGYEAATLEMLADRLSATKPFLYTYFKGKSAILSAICEMGVMESLSALERIEETDRNSLDMLKASLREVAEIILARHEYLMVYQREMMNLERADAQREALIDALQAIDDAVLDLRAVTRRLFAQACEEVAARYPLREAGQVMRGRYP